MKFFSHLNTAVRILEQYKGEVPFSLFLKAFFSQDSKYGSKDRKRIAHLCYCYFRLGQALKDMPVKERLLAGLFMCSHEPDELLEHTRSVWNAYTHLSAGEKMNLLYHDDIIVRLPDIFPWSDELSEGIDHEAFCGSFTVQPDLFLRVRPGHEMTVEQKLRKAQVDFAQCRASCLALPNALKIDTVIELDREAVVQDMNSQNTGSFFSSGLDGAGLTARRSESGLRQPNSGKIAVWDCCAASGGKSILAYDMLPNIDLTVSDIRETIIQNLKKRFARAGIKDYHALVLDLTTNIQGRHPDQHHAGNEAPNPAKHAFKAGPQAKLTSMFDLIICDAPCSGSGTWSRTPEQLTFFDPRRIDHYANLQRTIASNAIPYLKKNGRFVYITCSVFKKENEETVAFIRDKFPLQLEKMEILKGYDKKADTLFVASFLNKS